MMQHVAGRRDGCQLQPGVVRAQVVLARIVAELGVEPKVIATGGLARQISADSRYISEIDDMLTLDGLRILFERNRTPRQRRIGP